MNPSAAEDTADREPLYSPFWVLALVFLALIFLQSVYLRSDFIKQGQIQAARQQLTAPLNKAQTVTQLTEAVGRDLLAMASDSPEARKIIEEFKIQLNGPANPAK